MQVFDRSKAIFEFKANMEPIGQVKDGETFKVLTNDCFMQQIKSETDLVAEIDFGQVNPATGPFYVENADVGDILKVEILDIKVEEQGVIVALEGGGALGDLVKETITRVVDIKDGKVDYLGIKADVAPMIGVIGVSPGANQDPVVAGIPDNHGGNMDTTDVAVGASLYLPVREKGAMLALGDFHAIMGDGELCIAGLEVSGEATLKVSVIKDKQIAWPLLENKDEVMVITSAPTLDEAVTIAGEDITKHIQKAFDMKWEEAYIFNSMFTDFKISQVVNPNKTVRAVVDKNILSMETFLNNL